MGLVLKATTRDKLGTGEAKRSRAKGFIPAVIYGPGVSPEHILLDRTEFERVEKEVGETSFVTLVISNGQIERKIEKKVLIKEVERDSLRRVAAHVDFYQPKAGAKVRVKVPIAFIGTSALIETEGGVLVKSLQELEVTGIPEELPRELSLDISRIETFGERLLVKDIRMPEGVEAEEDPNVIVASILPVEKEEEAVALPSSAEGAVEQVKVEDEEKRLAREKEKEKQKQ